MKLEMAKFLQDTLEETAVTRKGAKGEKVAEFAHFMERVGLFFHHSLSEIVFGH